MALSSILWHHYICIDENARYSLIFKNNFICLMLPGQKPAAGFYREDSRPTGIRAHWYIVVTAKFVDITFFCTDTHYAADSMYLGIPTGKHNVYDTKTQYHGEACDVAATIRFHTRSFSALKAV
jgi:hypothetical protein